MEIWKLILIAIFLPLFPLSMVFNLLFTRLEHPALRAVLLMAWPLIGLTLVDMLQIQLNDSATTVLLTWSVLTSALYALRLLVLRELNIWAAFLATSLWALLWVPVTEGYGFDALRLDAIGFSAPLVLLVVLASLLTNRFGAAYAGLYNGIAEHMPRLSTSLVFSVLAAIGTPIFPVFFSMLSFLMLTTPLTAFALLLIWLLWSWAGARIIQGFVVGESSSVSQAGDICIQMGLVLVVALAALLVIGITLTGDML
jgi:hypothetical protein